MKIASVSVTSLIMLFFGFAVADAAAQADDDMLACRALTESAERLQCYDDIADRLMPVPVPIAVAPPAPVESVIEASEAAPVAMETKPTTLPAIESTPAPVIEPAIAQADPVDNAAVTPPANAEAENTTLDFGGEQLQDPSEGADTLESRLVGDFDGWWGDTVFTLENGQVWQQAQAGKKRYRGESNPVVTIRRRALGSYRLQVEGSNKTIRVKRLK